MKKLLFAAFILMAFASCEKIDMEPIQEQPKKIKMPSEKRIMVPIEWYKKNDDTVTRKTSKQYLK